MPVDGVTVTAMRGILPLRISPPGSRRFDYIVSSLEDRLNAGYRQSPGRRNDRPEDTRDGSGKGECAS